MTQAEQAFEAYMQQHHPTWGVTPDLRELWLTAWIQSRKQTWEEAMADLKKLSCRCRAGSPMPYKDKLYHATQCPHYVVEQWKRLATEELPQ